METTVPDYLRRMVVEGDYDGTSRWSAQNELLLALIDAVENQTAVQQRVADTFAELAKQD